MIKHYKVPVGIILMIVSLVLSGVKSVSGQCIPQVRQYATVQQSFNSLTASISDASSAIDGNPETFSTLSVPLGLLNLLSATQYLQFVSGANYIPANTPVTIKLSLPTSVLGVIDNVSIQATEDLRYSPALLGGRYIADNVGPSYSGASLLNLINGSGEIEITITPTSKFQGISVSISSALGVAVSAKIYDAYILQNGTANNICNSNIDVLSGIRAGSVVGGIANATGSVVNPRYAIDTDPTNTTYADLNLGLQVASEVFHTTIFKTPAQPGDAVQMIIQKPGGGLLDLNLLNSFSLRMYNGATPIGSAFNANSGLSLSLLPGSTPNNEKYTLTIQVPKAAGAFDRVELKMGGVLTLGLTPGIRIYDVKHIVLPKFAIDGLNVPSTTLCFGNSAALSVSEIQDCTTYKWFSSANGGTLLQTGTTYTPLASGLLVGANTFYLEATRTNCTDAIERVPVTINILSLPTASIAGTASVCQSAPVPNVVFTGANGTAPYQFSYTINSGAVNTISTTSGNSVSVPVPNALPGPYIYTLLSVKDNGMNQCSQTQTGSATVTITAKPQPPSLTINVNN
jgi:hypothetical protein